MSGIRLIPKTDESEFPYMEARQILLFELHDVFFKPTDFDALISAGKRVGWTAEMIAEHQAMAERKKCFDFRMESVPYLSGTLYEDNIFFSFYDSQQEKQC